MYLSINFDILTSLLYWYEYLKFDKISFNRSKFEGKEFGGEGYTKAEARFVRFIKATANNFPESNILIVSHGMELSFGINGLLKQPRMSIRERGGLTNTSTTILSTTDGENFVIEDWNNTSYLNKKQDDSTTIWWHTRKNN